MILRWITKHESLEKGNFAIEDESTVCAISDRDTQSFFYWEILNGEIDCDYITADDTKPYINLK